MKYIIFSLSLALMLFLPDLAEGKDVPMVRDPSVPAASGTVKTDRDKNGNFKIKVEVHHLAKPGALTPPKQVYVVWIKTPSGQPESEGQLRVNDNLDGTLETSTPYRQFDIFITAEDNAAATTPSGIPLLHATVEP